MEPSGANVTACRSFRDRMDRASCQHGSRIGCDEGHSSQWAVPARRSAGRCHDTDAGRGFTTVPSVMPAHVRASRMTRVFRRPGGRRAVRAPRPACSGGTIATCVAFWWRSHAGNRNELSRRRFDHAFNGITGSPGNRGGPAVRGDAAIGKGAPVTGCGRVFDLYRQHRTGVRADATTSEPQRDGGADAIRCDCSSVQPAFC